jgi:hypothetical protein
MTQLFEEALDIVGWFATGSRVICDPAPKDTDEDFCLYTNNLKTVRTQLEHLGYVYSNKDVEKYKTVNTDPFQVYNSFDAYRHPNNNHNLIVVSNVLDFKRWKVATLTAKALNITDKAQRVTLFRAIRSGGTVFQAPEDVKL